MGITVYNGAGIGNASIQFCAFTLSTFPNLLTPACPCLGEVAAGPADGSPLSLDTLF